MNRTGLALVDPARPEYHFSSLRLDAEGLLWRGDSEVHLPPRELAALRLLLASEGRIVTADQLRHELWGDVHVTPDSITKCLSSLRFLLEPDNCIQTIYKRGYRIRNLVSRGGKGADAALPRLAILPFETTDGVADHLGRAIADETTAQLSNLAQPVAVMLARDSVFALADHQQTALQIGQTLRTDYVLTGSLRALPTHTRLRAEMVRVSDGAQLWVEDLLVDQDGLFNLDMELAERLVTRLQTAPFQCDATEALPLRRSGTTRQREAYDAYLRGRHEWLTLQRHRVQDGAQHLQHALECDANLIAARLELVRVHVAQSYYGFLTPRTAAEMIRRVATPVVNQASDAELLLPALGWISFHVDHDLASALQYFSASAHLPHDLWTTHLRAVFALSRQRFPEAEEILTTALDHDPYSPWLQARLAWALHLSGQASRSMDQIRRTLQMFPGHEAAFFYASLLFAYNGEAAQATQFAHGLTNRFAYFDLATAVHAYTLACANRRDEARALLERLQWLSRERYLLCAFIPAVHVALGDHESALNELRNSAESRCPWFFQMLADPRLAPLHDRAEFHQLRATLTRMEESTQEVEELLELAL